VVPRKNGGHAPDDKKPDGTRFEPARSPAVSGDRRPNHRRDNGEVNGGDWSDSRIVEEMQIVRGNNDDRQRDHRGAHNARDGKSNSCNRCGNLSCANGRDRENGPSG
jgi:hypothetical protein